MEEKVLSQFIRKARSLGKKSNCPKAQNGVVIIKNGAVISEGWNSCEPQGYSRDIKITDCPRMNLPTSVGYEICHIVHGEVSAILNIRKNRPKEHYVLCESHITPTEKLVRQLFTEAELKLLCGATLILSGHYYACQNCEAFANLVGIKEITFDPFYAEKTKKFYRNQQK